MIANGSVRPETIDPNAFVSWKLVKTKKLSLKDENERRRLMNTTIRADPVQFLLLHPVDWSMYVSQWFSLKLYPNVSPTAPASSPTTTTY
uniref:Uncharacterized protein n=1 Tax=Vespula pensylvanica TaxID=30213 RepID=A0A834PCC3_VESPE|nr:hypothetical protein H0235_003638 [Vespula pensylvanica]